MDLEALISTGEDDKTYYAMGIAKTIWTVWLCMSMGIPSTQQSRAQVINSIESAPEILAQVQEIVIPIVTFTLENKFLGKPYLFAASNHALTFASQSADLFDSMYELVDSLTFKLRAISPSVWPVFELTYKLFKSDAVDYLEGRSLLRPCFQNVEFYSRQTCAKKCCLPWIISSRLVAM